MDSSVNLHCFEVTSLKLTSIPKHHRILKGIIAAVCFTFTINNDYVGMIVCVLVAIGLAHEPRRQSTKISLR